MALPMALGVMLVLSISIFATLQFTGASSRESSLNETRQRAKGFAEAGVNYGASVLAQQLADTSGSFASDLPETNTTIQGAPVRWRATYQAGSPKTWLVRATATLPNPTGPTAAPIPRTVEAQFQWAATGPPSQWHGLYVGNPGTRLFMSNAEASIATDVYARGDLTITQGKFLGQSLQVWGSLTLTPGCSTGSEVCYDASIGASDRVNCGGSDYRSFKSNFPAPCPRSTHRVTTFKVKDGCRFSGDSSPLNSFSPANCRQTSRMGGPSGKIWLTCPTCTDPAPAGSKIGLPSSPSVDSTAFSVMGPADYFELFAPDLPATWNLGPGEPCQPTSPPDFGPPSFGLGVDAFNQGEPDIMGSSYTCKSADGLGELSWNDSTKKLTAKGIIYFNSKLKLQSGRWGEVAPLSDGKIHMADKLTLTNNTGLCGKKHATTSPTCDATWDPLAAGNLVSFIVHSPEPEAILQDNFHFQGGLYTSHSNGGYLVQNNSSFKGPTTFEGGVEIKNNGTIDAWAPSSPPSSSSGGSMELTLIRGSWRG
jgi:hypothetical protein